MEAIKSNTSLQVLKITSVNLRNNSMFHIALAVLIAILTPILSSVNNLDVKTAAVPLEMIIALIGIVLLTPIFLPEQNSEIDDLVSSKFINPLTIHIIRIAYSLISLMLIVLAFATYMIICGSQITFGLIAGTIAEAMFLGAIGMFAASVINNTAIAYMIPMMYYTINFGGGSKLGNFFLFSMQTADFTPKVWLFFASMLLIILALMFKHIQKKLK